MSRIFSSRGIRSAAAALLLAAFLPAPAHAAGTVVVSQVYGGGGLTGATYTNDFIELFNPGASAVNLMGWSVQYGSAAGLIGTSVGPLGGSIAPGGYYLVALASGGMIGMPLPAADAAAPTINMSNTSGKVALVNSTTALNCGNTATPCQGAQLMAIVDLVGYGTADYYEGAGPVPQLGPTTAGVRKVNGCIDTDDNAQDFLVQTPFPRNGASPTVSCAVAPALTGAASRKAHGAATFDLPLAP